jgi:hypothetical protein
MLLRCFSAGRHDWVADTGTVEVVKRYFATHAPTMADTCVSLARKGTVAAAWRGSVATEHTVTIKCADLVDCTQDLCAPAVLVVEDAESDGAFVRSVLAGLTSARLQRALSNDWLRIEHGGGERTVRVAMSARSRFRKTVRVLVLLDSDRLLPDQRTAAHDKANELVKQGIVVHVLELREAENYTPYRVLATIGKRPAAAQKVALLRKMSSAQRGFFDMKNGFGPTNGQPVIQPGQRTLYQGLPHYVVSGLRGGFGKDILRRMERHTLSEHDFASLGDGVLVELKRLLATLNALI